MHRQKADEAYEIGQRGQYTPVGAYLASDEIVKIAVEHEVNMIHSGYGFLSENAEFARKVEQAGLIVSLPFVYAMTLTSWGGMCTCMLICRPPTTHPSLRELWRGSRGSAPCRGDRGGAPNCCFCRPATPIEPLRG